MSQRLKLSKKFISHIPIIDYQHEILLNMSRRLEEVYVKEGAFFDLFIELNAFLHYHFKTEEEYMRLINYPGYETHKKEHDNLLKKYEDLTKTCIRSKNFDEMNKNNKELLICWLLANIGIKQESFALDLDLINYIKRHRKFL